MKRLWVVEISKDGGEWMPKKSEIYKTRKGARNGMKEWCTGLGVSLRVVAYGRMRFPVDVLDESGEVISHEAHLDD